MNVLLPMSWADIQRLPPGPRRDQLAYAWRLRTQAARDRKAEAATEALLTAAEAQHILDQIRPDPEPMIAARRRDLVHNAVTRVRKDAS